MAVFIKREYDYAIRICAYLAGYYKKEYISVPKVAKKLYLTIPFTTKIVHQLKNNKIVETVQGKYGGIRLKINPEKLSFFDILNAMGFDMTVNECLKNPSICPIVKNCKVHRFFLSQEEVMVENMRSAIIQDFIITDDELGH